MNITLEIGTNILTALNYDDQNQPGPDSPAVTVIVEPVIIDEEETTDPPGDDSVTPEEVPLVTAPGDDPLVQNEKQPLFENTFLEPIAQLLDIDATVTPTAKTVFTLIMSTVFISVIAAPLLWGVFILFALLFARLGGE